MKKFTCYFKQKKNGQLNLRKCVCVAAILSVSLSVLAQGYPEASYKLSDDKTILESWNGDEADIDMNSDENLKNISEIGDYAFDGNKNIKSIILGDNVKAIGAGAFVDCI